MADETDDAEKTEEPSQKKLEDAHKRGDVAKSQEVNTWFVLLASTMVVGMFGGDMARKLSASMEVYLSRPHLIPVDGGHMQSIAFKIGIAIVAAIGLPLLMLALAAIAGNMIQHRLILTVDPIKPKLSKISPFAGAKRLFSTTSLVNFTKGVIKLAVVGTLMVVILWPQRDELATLISMDPSMMLPSVVWLILKVMFGVLAVMGLVAAADYAYQRFTWYKKQRMTLKELRDEYKQMEGDPAVRAKLRQIRVERGRKRMMANVPKASVVITNPTHYAVALQYEQGMAAPICLAKGADRIALKIREIATENDIPIVENPPLARALHASVEIDEEIPPEHYKAVAKVISFILQLRAKKHSQANKR